VAGTSVAGYGVVPSLPGLTLFLIDSRHFRAGLQFVASLRDSAQIAGLVPRPYLKFELIFTSWVDHRVLNTQISSVSWGGSRW
jgi:hypothetical protein